MVVGLIGIFIPLLPTTPLLLLSAACYLRSSSKAYNYLMSNKLLGSYVKNYTEKRAIPKKIKIFTILLLCLTLLFSIVFVVQNISARAFLFLILIVVTAHILSIKTLK